ncbi:MAG: ABC transporter ATP-binding protein [Candidatus Mucispirillum faecigallinarum]|nr:ABC transporter ATP-binding protein [Candidatus Mucispirillum faecigallinarum]
MIKVNNISYSIKNNDIIHNISLNIKPGQMISIIGPNGAGKSTLANIIAGIIKPDKGNVTIYDKNILKINKKEKAKLISYVPQQVSFSVSDFTVEDFVATGRYPYLDYFGTITKEHLDKIHYYMNLTNIYHLKERHISTLSGGERQKVNIAAALAQEAEFMLLDEISSFLDPKAKYEINNLLVKLNQENKYSIILITHDLNYALAVNSSFICIKKGKLFAYAESNEMVEKNIFSSLFDMEFIYLKENQRTVIVPK